MDKANKFVEDLGDWAAKMPPVESILDKHESAHPISSNYFTPSIEEIRVGYECETINPVHRGEWYPTTINKGNISWIEFLDCVRVPYLTKEQIEKEGFKTSD